MKPARPERYTPIAQLLHWLMAALILGQLAVGLYMKGLPLTPTKFEIYQMHKSFGLAILLLVLVRLSWRLTHRPPVLSNVPAWEKGIAHATHWTLYLLMLALPLSGWYFSDAEGYHPSLFGLPVPILATAGAANGHFWEEFHEIGAFILAGLVGLHIAAALKHHFFDKDNVLLHMLPTWLNIPRRFWVLTAAALLLASAAQAQVWNINPGASSLGFIASFNGQPITGTFKNWNGKIYFDPNNLPASDIAITIPTAGVSTGEWGRDQTLQSPEWFDTKQFPNASFTCTSISPGAAPETYIASGTLSLAGVTKPLSFPFKLAITADKARMTANIPLSRTERNVGKGVWQTSYQIADTVTVTVVLNATKAK